MMRVVRCRATGGGAWEEGNEGSRGRRGDKRRGGGVVGWRGRGMEGQRGRGVEVRKGGRAEEMEG